MTLKELIKDLKAELRENKKDRRICIKNGASVDLIEAIHLSSVNGSLSYVIDRLEKVTEL